MVIMITIGIDIAKENHYACVMDNRTGEVLIEPFEFKNNKEGFNNLLSAINPFKDYIVGFEDTGHYGDNLLFFLLSDGFKVGLINPITIEMKRKSKLKTAKNDKLDTLLIAQALIHKDEYRLVNIETYHLRDLKKLTRHHHDLKEDLNVYKNRLQKSIDLVFPEFNKLFGSKYGVTYMNLLERFGSAETISKTDMRVLRKAITLKGSGKPVSFTAEELKALATNSIGEKSLASEFQVKHLIMTIRLMEEQVKEVDAKIKELSMQLNSPITSIPGIGTFSGMSILSEYGDINKFDSAAKLISFAGVAPYVFESGQFAAGRTSITKKGNPYLRKTLYQIALPVIRYNPVFYKYYTLKRHQGKSHRCALGHVVRKLLRIIYHLVSNDILFDEINLN